MSPTDKPVVWLHGQVKTPPFSPAARLEAGIFLCRLQGGETIGLPHSRPMPSIGANCHALRITDRNATWRIVYQVDPDAVVILEVFAKKTAATPKPVIEACQRRLAEYLRFKTLERR
jgi:phage-related protein